MMTDMFSFCQWLDMKRNEYKTKLDYATMVSDAGGIIGYGITLACITNAQEAWKQSIEYRASLDALGDNIKDYECDQ